jgi:hypothetical protein
MTDRPRRHYVRRIAAVLVTVVTATTLLAGCGGDSPYCASVKEHRAQLDSFGEKPSTKAYTRYSRAVHEIRQEAAAEIKPDWTALDKALRAVLTAQKKAGITLEEMANADKLAQLDSDDLTTLNTAYSAFGKTVPQRKAIVADIKSTCDITLE